jgi:hypothetical protein
MKRPSTSTTSLTRHTPWLQVRVVRPVHDAERLDGVPVRSLPAVDGDAPGVPVETLGDHEILFAARHELPESAAQPEGAAPGRGGIQVCLGKIAVQLAAQVSAMSCGLACTSHGIHGLVLRCSDNTPRGRRGWALKGPSIVCERDQYILGVISAGASCVALPPATL